MRILVGILIATVATVLLLVAGAALFISLADPNDYRSSIADVVETFTGRKLRVDGDLQIALLPVLTLEANDIAFANAPWGSQTDMVRAGHLRAKVALLPLLKGQVIVEELVVLAPELFLETDAKGRGNWELSSAKAPDAERRAAGAPFDGLPVQFMSLRVERGNLDYFDALTSRKIVLGLDELAFGGESPDNRVALNVSGRYQNLPFSLSGRLGAAGAILRNQPIDVDLEGIVGDADFSVRGSVGKPLQGRDLRLELALASASTRRISDAAGIELEELGPVDLSIRVLEENGHLSLNPLSASARLRGTEARITGSITDFALTPAPASVDESRQRRAMKVALQGTFGESAFEVAGDVGRPREGKDVNLAVVFETPTTAGLSELAGIELEEIGPLNLTFTLREQGTGYDFDDIRVSARPRDTDASASGSFKHVVVDDTGKKAEPAKIDVEGFVGEARFAVSGEVGKPLEARDLHLKVAVDAKATRPLTDLVGVDVEEVGPVRVALTVHDEDGRFDLVDIDATARPRSADVVVKGSVRDILKAPKPDLELKVSAQSLRRIEGTLPDSGPVNVSARVQPSGDVIEVRDIVAKIGKSDLAGSATIDTGGERPQASAKLRGALIDLAELAPARGEKQPGEAAEQPARSKVFPDQPLPFDMLAKANGDLDIAVDRLVTSKLTLDRVSIVAKLADGKLTLEPAAHVAGGTVGGTIAIDSRAQPAKVTATVDAKKVSIAVLMTTIRGYEASRGLVSDLTMKLSGHGDSPAAVMAGLSGDLRLVIGEGQLNNEMLDRVGADLFTQMVGVVVPTDEKAKVTAIECGVVRFAIDNGDAVADETLVMETNKVLLKGSGLIDLKTEELDLGANLAAREGIRIGAGTLSSLVRVRGTLAAPRMGSDLAGVAKTGARVGIAFATGGLSLLAESAYGYVSEDEHPCQTALEHRIEADPGFFRALSASEKPKSAPKED